MYMMYTMPSFYAHIINGILLLHRPKRKMRQKHNKK